MTSNEFREYLRELSLTQVEVAELLSVDGRTVRRWAEELSEIPGPTEQALRAWVRLKRRGLAWRPDFDALGEDEVEIADQIAKLRSHNLELDAVIQEVERRGGPKYRVTVDLRDRTASSNKIEVGFYALPNGGFSPSTYRRRDQETDQHQDTVFLQDAYYCIAEAISKAGKSWFLH